jgi:hypothetical protein
MWSIVTELAFRRIMSPASELKNKPSVKQAAAGFAEDGCDKFLRNVSYLSTDCRALCPRR